MKTSLLTPVLTAAGVAALVLWHAGSPTASAAEQQKVAFLGVSVAKVDDTLRHQLKLSRGAGLRIVEVVDPGPAEKAGLKAHDILEKLDDQLLVNGEQLATLVRSHEPGDKLALKILRQGSSQAVEVTLGETELDPQESQLELDNLPYPHPYGALLGRMPMLDRALGDPLARSEAAEPEAFLGVSTRAPDASLTAQLGLETETGALVETVVKDSPAEKAGLQAHDVLLKLDQRTIKGPEDLVRQIRKHKKGDLVKLEIIRAGKTASLEATLAQRTKTDWKSLGPLPRQHRVVPRVEVGPAPDRKGESIVVLKSPGQSLVTKTVTLPGGSSTAQQHQSMQQHHTATVVVKSDDGSVTVNRENGQDRVVVKDPQDEVVFEGPFNTDQEKSKAPAKVRERLEKVLKEIQLDEPSATEIEEIRLLRPTTTPKFIRHESIRHSAREWLRS